MRSLVSPDTLLDRVAEGALRICDGDWSAVGLLDLTADALRVRRWETSPHAVAATLSREPCEPELTRGLREGRAYGSSRPGGPFPSRDPLVAGTLTSLVAPIRVDGRLEGVLCVGRRSPGRFWERERSFLRWLADQAAMVIAHARLLQEAERRRKEAEELAVLSQIMSQSLDSQEVAQRIVDSMRRLLGALTCVLYGLDSSADPAVEPLAASGVPCDRIPPHPPGIGAVGLALSGLRTVTTSDILSDSRIRVTPALREFVQDTDHGAVLAVPLCAGDRPIGVLAARGRTHRAWTADEVRLARMFADQATIAIENARLFAESRRQRRTAEALALVARATSRPFDLRSLGQQIVDTVLLLTGGGRATLLAQDPASDGFRLVAVARRAELAASADVTAPEPGPVEALAARERRLVCTTDFLREPGLGAAIGSGPGEGAAIRAVLATPLFHGNTAIGILSVADRAGRVFGSDEVNVFLAAADHAAVALQSAYLHAQVTEAALVQERIDIANELHDTLSQLAFSAGLKLDWCLHQVSRTSPLRPKLEDIRRDTGLMMAQIRHLIGHLGVEGSAEATLPRRLELLADEFRELTGTAVEFTLDGDPTRLSPAVQEALHKTLQEALVNIAKHARATRATIHIEVGAVQALIAVADDGVGLPAGVVETNGGGSPGHQGLRQMRERIEALGGRLEIAAHPGSGVHVRGVLPLDDRPPSGGPRSPSGPRPPSARLTGRARRPRVTDGR
ncbi:MAG: GAF domain-containing protein [Candidatus Rokuibacteriota bacterium]